MLEKILFGVDEEEVVVTPQKIIVKNLLFKTELNDIVDNVKKDIVMIINVDEIKNKEELNYYLAFLEGAAYAVCGTFKQVSEKTYILSSENVEVQDELHDII